MSESEFSISVTHDEEFISSCVSKLFDKITVDEFPSFPVTSGLFDTGRVSALEVRYKGERVGAWMFVDDEVHTLLLEPIRGSLAIKAAREAIRWTWENTDRKYIDSFYYNHRPDVAWFCRTLGFVKIRTEDTPYHFNGQPVVETKVRLMRP